MVKQKPFAIIWDTKALEDFKEILSFLSKQTSQAPKIVKDGVLSRLEIIKTNALIWWHLKYAQSSDFGQSKMFLLRSETFLLHRIFWFRF